MRSLILYGATHLLFAAALAIDPNVNLLHVHEHIQYNRHVMDTIPEQHNPAPHKEALDTPYTSLCLVPTQSPYLTASKVAMAPIEGFTAYEYDEADNSDEGLWPQDGQGYNDDTPSSPLSPMSIVTVTAQPNGCVIAPTTSAQGGGCVIVPTPTQSCVIVPTTTQGYVSVPTTTQDGVIVPTSGIPAPTPDCGDNDEEDETDTCDEPVEDGTDSCDPPVPTLCDSDPQPPTLRDTRAPVAREHYPSRRAHAVHDSCAPPVVRSKHATHPVKDTCAPPVKDTCDAPEEEDTGDDSTEDSCAPEPVESSCEEPVADPCTTDTDDSTPQPEEDTCAPAPVLRDTCAPQPLVRPHQKRPVQRPRTKRPLVRDGCGCGSAPAPVVRDNCGCSPAPVVRDNCGCTPPPVVRPSCHDTAPPSGCGQYEHQYGDDAINFVIDAKDHTRNRLERVKGCAGRQVSHFAPSHVHDRISQVVHDRRPVNSLEHVQLHENTGHLTTQQKRAMSRRARRYRNADYNVNKNNYRHSYQRSGYTPVRRPTRVDRSEFSHRPAGHANTHRNQRTPTSRGRTVRASDGSCGCDSDPVPVPDDSQCSEPVDSCGCDTPAPAPEPTEDCGCSAPAPVVRTPCGCGGGPARRRRAPVRDACPVAQDTCPEAKDVGGGCCSNVDHQFGDDAMSFVLDTKDHTRNFLGRMKERTKHAVSHFAPCHIHDRVDQFVHDERPERSEDHLELHENRGYLS